MDLIIYHNNCPDGFTAAYVAHQRYPEAKLFPRDHGLEPPYEEVAHKDVLVVDFSWRTKEQNRKIADLTRSFRILDHHKTAQAELEGEPYAIFDMNRSGAGLAWDYLYGDDVEPTVKNPAAIGLPRPWWVNYVEDRDLWRFKLSKSEEVNDYIMTFPYTIEGWDELVRTPGGAEEAAAAGQYVRLQVTKYVREASKQALDGYMNAFGKHYTVKVVNVPYLNTSEVGNELSKYADIGLGWFERADGMIQCSLRSKGEVDVSVIAKHFGGGGHKNAAGFQVSLEKGRRIIDAILGRDLTYGSIV